MTSFILQEKLDKLTKNPFKKPGMSVEAAGADQSGYSSDPSAALIRADSALQRQNQAHKSFEKRTYNNQGVLIEIDQNSVPSKR